MKPPEVIWLRPRGISPGGFIHLFCNIFSPFFVKLPAVCDPQTEDSSALKKNKNRFLKKTHPNQAANRGATLPPFGRKGENPAELHTELGGRQFDNSLLTNVTMNYVQSFTRFCDGSRPAAFQEMVKRSREEASPLLHP